MTDELYKFIYINKVPDIDPEDTKLDVANKLFDYLTDYIFG